MPYHKKYLRIWNNLSKKSALKASLNLLFLNDNLSLKIVVPCVSILSDNKANLIVWKIHTKKCFFQENSIPQKIKGNSKPHTLEIHSYAKTFQNLQLFNSEFIYKASIYIFFGVFFYTFSFSAFLTSSGNFPRFSSKPMSTCERCQHFRSISYSMQLDVPSHLTDTRKSILLLKILLDHSLMVVMALPDKKVQHLGLFSEADVLMCA